MSRKRGLLTSLLNRLVARQLGFPPETCSWTVSNVRIPVQHGNEQFGLLGDLYQPIFADNSVKLKGTILVRCPYGRGLAFALTTAHLYAARGYNCLLVSCRGTFGSEGVLEPWRNEEEDGHAVVQWMREQEWYTGTFATLGSSYLGFVQWALLKNPPPDMVAAAIHCAPHDFSQQLWGTGALALEWVTWGERMLHQEEKGLLKTWEAANTPKRMRPVLDRRPVVDSIKAHFDGKAPWLDFIIDHPDTSHPFYSSMKYGEALERTAIPVLLVTGWQDLFVRQTIEQFTRLNERGTHVALLVGPWTHMQLGMASKTHRQSYNWLEEHLAKKSHAAPKPGVEYFVTGANMWRDAPIWPPPTSQKTLYLGDSNSLGFEKCISDKTSSSFTFDHEDPTPTIGGNTLLGGGNLEDTALASRPDVLHFTTSPLEKDMEIAGSIAVELVHSCDVLQADLAVRISEVNTSKQSHLVTETYQRFQSGDGDGISKVEVRLDDCAHRFKKGNRIRLYISGGSHPRYMSIGENAVHNVYYGEGEIAKVVFPVVT